MNLTDDGMQGRGTEADGQTKSVSHLRRSVCSAQRGLEGEQNTRSLHSISGTRSYLLPILCILFVDFASNRTEDATLTLDMMPSHTQALAPEEKLKYEAKAAPALAAYKLVMAQYRQAHPEALSTSTTAANSRATSVAADDVADMSDVADAPEA